MYGHAAPAFAAHAVLHRTGAHHRWLRLASATIHTLAIAPQPSMTADDAASADASTPAIAIDDGRREPLEESVESYCGPAPLVTDASTVAACSSV